MRYVFHAMWLLFTGVSLAAPVELQLLGIDGKPLSGTVISLRSTNPAIPVATPVAATIDQLDLQFSPAVVILPVGSPITFPNTDSVSHQVYSFSAPKRFQLPLYRGKPYPPVVFDREGVVTLGCNIHDQMRAYVYVVQAQHFGRVDAAGSWSAPDVQPGTYDVTVWHPLSRQQKPVLVQRITVDATRTQAVLRATSALKLRSDAQVPANWDAY